MSRPLRIQYPDAIYHVCARGNERRRIFWGDETYSYFLELLQRACERFSIELYSFVLMPNHFHIMLKTPLANLSETMHWLKTSYSVYANRRQNRVGHLFQGRYYSVLVENESHYLELSRYIHLNPIRAKMLKEPELYPWSSCADYLSKKQRYNWVNREPMLSELGGTDRKRYRRYKEYLYSAVGVENSFFDKFRKGIVIGSDQFKNWLQEKFDILDDSNCPQIKDITNVSKPEIEETIRRLKIELKNNCKCKELRQDRATMMYMLYKLGYRLSKIGEKFDVSYSAVSHAAKRYKPTGDAAKAIEMILSNVKR